MGRRYVSGNAADFAEQGEMRLEWPRVEFYSLPRQSLPKGSLKLLQGRRNDRRRQPDDSRAVPVARAIQAQCEALAGDLLGYRAGGGSFGSVSRSEKGEGDVEVSGKDLLAMNAGKPRGPAMYLILQGVRGPEGEEESFSGQRGSTLSHGWAPWQQIIYNYLILLIFSADPQSLPITKVRRESIS